MYIVSVQVDAGASHPENVLLRELFEEYYFH
jgi:hypothetical protein